MREIRTYADAPDGSVPIVNGTCRCPGCRRRVPPDMLRDYAALPSSARLPRWACDACGERAVMEGRITRKAVAIALGQSPARVWKAQLLDARLPGRKSA
jgi:hypothetical protein